MNKTKLLGWMVVLLLLLNGTILGTIIYHNNSQKAENEDVVVDPVDKVVLNGRFFKRNLGFDAEQMSVFRSANQAFQPLAQEKIAKINQIKQLIFEELRSNNPDTLLLNSYADETGKLHAELKKATHRFYIKLHDVCDEEQRVLLREAFTPLFQSDDCGNEIPGGRRRGRDLNKYDSKDTMKTD